MSPEELDALTNQIFPMVQPYTMVPVDGIRLTIELAIDTIDANIPGAFVECGTWRGGSSFAVLLAQQLHYGQIQRPIYMFDSFEGLPAPTTKDGPEARYWTEFTKANPGAESHFNNCTATLQEAMDGAMKLGLLSHCRFHQGWFQDTIPPVAPLMGPIAFLRLDADWYESCKFVYDKFGSMLSNHARVIIDDYIVWPGAARATHEWLVENNKCWRIRTNSSQYCAYMIKDDRE